MFTDLLFIEKNGEMVLPFANFIILYVVVLILAALLYKLGFARKLPILKTVIVYIALAIGAIPLSFLGIALPFVEALFIAVVILAIVRLRMRKSDSKEERRGQ